MGFYSKLADREQKIGNEHFGYGTIVYNKSSYETTFSLNIPTILDANYVIIASNGDYTSNAFSVVGTTVIAPGQVEIVIDNQYRVGYV